MGVIFAFFVLLTSSQKLPLCKNITHMPYEGNSSSIVETSIAKITMLTVCESVTTKKSVTKNSIVFLLDRLIKQQ